MGYIRVVPVCGREFVIQGHMESVPSVGRIPSAVVRYARDTPLHVSIGIQMVVLLQWNLRSGSRIDDGDNILHYDRHDEVYPPVAISHVKFSKGVGVGVGRGCRYGKRRTGE